MGDFMKSMLAQMCLKTITLLDQLKADGQITEKEYQENVKLKLQFLSNTMSLSELNKNLK